MKAHEPLPPFLYSSSDPQVRRWMNGLKKEKRIWSLGPRLFTSLPKKDIEKAVRGNWSEIVSHLFPHALLSHRSALEYRPTDDGEIFLTGSTNREIRYPGLTLKFIRGPGALPDDLSFTGFTASSLHRALLENLSISKGRDKHKVWLVEKIENYLEGVLHQKGERGLSEIRDQAKKTAKQLGWDKELQRLQSIIGAMLGSRDSRKLKSSLVQARALNRPYDPACMTRFEALFAELQQSFLQERTESVLSATHWTNKAFFESYFSNYIEGTTFEIEEAEEIIFEKRIPEKRPKDAHDILSTYRLVSDRKEMSAVPKTPEDFIRLLLNRHAVLMQERQEVSPGVFKSKPNRAGNTHFVHPDYVEGTLQKGFDLYRSVHEGLKRAIFMMFVVAEVHPFLDGNGRVARIMMNAELVASESPTIIIPTVYREDYLLALRALSRRERPAALVKMLDRAQVFSSLDFSSYPQILKLLQSRGWFLEPDEGKIVD